MREKVLQELVRRTARAFGWGFYHTHNSRHSPAGFPDCVMVKGGRLVFAELKTDRGKFSEHQTLWLTALRQVPGVEVHEWRPADWYSGRIEEVLR